MDEGRLENLDPYKEIGITLVTLARVSRKYWESNYTDKSLINKPFFDRTQCEWILNEYKGIKNN